MKETGCIIIKFVLIDYVLTCVFNQRQPHRLRPFGNKRLKTMNNQALIPAAPHSIFSIITISIITFIAKLYKIHRSKQFLHSEDNSAEMDITLHAYINMFSLRPILTDKNYLFATLEVTRSQIHSPCSYNSS